MAWAHNTACKDYYIAEDLNTPAGNTNRWTVFQKQHGLPFNDPTIGIVRGTSADDVFNKLGSTPGAKIKQANVIKNPLNQSWSDIIKSYKKDPLNQEWTGSAWVNLRTRPANAPSDHAHHIVMKKGAGATVQHDVRRTQAILQRYDIDPYFGNENLVWAPNWLNHSQVTTTYAHEVYNEVKNLTSRGDVVFKLKDIAMRFIDGDWQ
jgi:hypothetical protein